MTPFKDPSAAATKIILDSISDGVFTIDHQWRITSFNRSAERITGIAKKDALGKHCWDVFHSNMCRKECALKKTMTMGTDNINSSTRIVTTRGNSIPISVSTSLLRDDNGEILGGVETFRDLSLVENLKKELSGSVKFGGMESRSPEMKRIFSILKQVAESDSPVLIEGETGTGKELLSRAIHSLSKRNNHKFLAINCGALPDTLLESELFGYKAGAFTGARRDKQGLFASAGEGTILLDEIGDTSQAFQVKLLRLLEEKEFQPLGSVTVHKSKARILAATNKNLEEMTESKEFRRDLYYRINVIHLKLPALRKRREDIPLLAETFLRKMNLAKGKEIEALSPGSLSHLMAHDYPGNVRELENIIEHGFALCTGKIIEPQHLPESLQTIRPDFTAGGTVREATLHSLLEKEEEELILATLKECGYNRKETARKLGINKSTLYRKIERLNISLPKTDGRSAKFYTP